MICENTCDTLLPRQPFMVKCSSQYYKKVINRFGISHFYSFQQDHNTLQIETSVPDGCMDIIFHYDAGKNDVGASLYGSPLAPRSFDMIPGYHYFGIRFLPGNLPLLAGICMADVINKVTPLDFRLKDDSLTEMIENSDSFEQQINVFMSYYMNSLEHEISRAKNFEFKKYLVNEILKRNGNVKVNELALDSNYSVRYVNSTFKAEVGISPKEFCRIIRFQKCLSDLCTKYTGCNDFDMDTMSLNLGYSDQSHMIRDFKEFTKRTPSAFLNELGRFDYLKRLKIVE
jgi:AraC-like DNA-binding protein